MAEHRAADAHPTQEQLDAAAAGEAVPESVTEHLGRCVGCRAEVDAVARVLIALSDPIPREDPPAHLWERIRDELEQEPGEASPPRGPSGRGVPHERIGPDELAERRTRRPLWRVAAVGAAAGFVLGAGGAALLGGLLGEGGAPEPTAPPPVAEVGEAELDPTTEDDVQGTARMVSSDVDGQQLVVSVSDLPEDGYYEVWLRDESASRLISLGTVTSTTTTLPVPQGVDLTRFPIVDVSQEHFDGDPSHSGVTVAAGPMVVADGE